jgi:hypothetical protein
MKRLLSACLLVATWMAGCGLVAAGDEGSESHWLSACEDDSDCSAGQCLCGVCSEHCDTVLACPFPMDECTTASGTVANGTCTTTPETGICGVSTPDRISLSSSQSRVSGCDDGRSSSLHLQKDFESVHTALPLGDEGFALFGGGSSVITVGTAGELRQVLRSPSSDLVTVTDLERMPDGTFVLAGKSYDVPGHTAWVGKLDANWNLLWEVELGSPGALLVHLEALSDGGVIASSGTWQSELTTVEPPAGWSPSLFWGRIDADGQVLWQQEQAAEVFGVEDAHDSMMTVTTELEVKLTVPSPNGLVLVSSDLDGAFHSQVLDTELALLPIGIAALPDGRIALASNDSGAVLTIVNADGSVAWEKRYSHTRTNAVAYDPTRDEIVLVGAYLGGNGAPQRTWMIATDLEGNQTFQLEREPQELQGPNGLVGELDPDTGPALMGVTVNDTGRILATSDSNELMYFLVGPEACE